MQDGFNSGFREASIDFFNAAYLRGAVAAMSLFVAGTAPAAQALSPDATRGRARPASGPPLHFGRKGTSCELIPLDVTVEAWTQSLFSINMRLNSQVMDLSLSGAATPLGPNTKDPQRSRQGDIVLEASDEESVDDLPASSAAMSVELLQRSLESFAHELHADMDTVLRGAQKDEPQRPDIEENFF